jgi:hypothetical protein
MQFHNLKIHFIRQSTVFVHSKINQPWPVLTPFPQPLLFPKTVAAAKRFQRVREIPGAVRQQNEKFNLPE